MALIHLILPGYVFAQSNSNPHSIAGRAIFHNYEWPSNSIEELRISDFKSGFEFEYYRFLSDQFNLSFPVRINNSLLLIDENGSQFMAGSIGLDALIDLKLIKEGWFRSQLFTGTGLILEDLKDINIVLPVGMNFDFPIGQNSFFSIGTSYRLSLKNNRSHLQVGAGLKFNLPSKKEQKPKDKDEDGIPDHKDLCPDEAGTESTNGCPDQDKDGIIDIEDDCPKSSGPINFNGCPDTDKDGLIDIEDDCPLHSGPVRNSGCPDVYTHRKRTEELKTPQISEKFKKNEEETKGQYIQVPSSLNSSTQQEISNDKNEILNSLVNSTENKSIDASINPELNANNSHSPINEVDRQILINAGQSIEFEAGSAIIKKNSYHTLNEISAVMQRNWSYKLLIEGHTDATGLKNDNQILSERRALACFNYLLMQGTDRSRMKYAGYGESRPIDSNAIEYGRRLNRRVEFNLFID